MLSLVEGSKVASGIVDPRRRPRDSRRAQVLATSTRSLNAFHKNVSLVFYMSIQQLAWPSPLETVLVVDWRIPP
jgi:hypothetical protein